MIAGKYPINHEISENILEIFNLLPNTSGEEIVKAFAVKTNDMMVAVYLSSLIRSVIGLHDLINNKTMLREAEEKKSKEKEGGAKEEKKEGKDEKKAGEIAKEGGGSK